MKATIIYCITLLAAIALLFSHLALGMEVKNHHIVILIMLLAAMIRYSNNSANEKNVSSNR